MDRVVAVNPWRRRIRIGAITVALGILAAVAWYVIPKGVTVKSSDLTVATVRRGVFRDELVVRASVIPLESVVLDAVEGGRVEQVVAHDGALVKKGDLMFRLSNLQREQELVARSADAAQQLSNLSSQRAALAGSRSSYRRDLAGLEFDLDRQAKTHARNVGLAAQGFIAASALEESADRLTLQRRLLDQGRADSNAELDTRERAVRELEGAVKGLKAGLDLLRKASDGLSVRAPTDGRLTGFQLQVGQSIKQGERIGRVDSPDSFKLTASLDEFYLNRISAGLKAKVSLPAGSQSLTLARVDPEVKDGRFLVELTFDAQPASARLQSGQGLDTRITLGQPTNALILADGAFYADSGGLWVYVLIDRKSTAVRRSVRLGRRAAGEIEVLDGLNEGDDVIVSGYKRFGDATTLNITK